MRTQRKTRWSMVLSSSLVSLGVSLSMSLTLGLGLVAGCGAKRPAVVPAAVTSTSASTSTSAKPDSLSAEDRRHCERVCVVQNRCGGDSKTCLTRCSGIAGVLESSVMGHLVGCVESKAPTGCDDSTSERRKALIGSCTKEATSGREEAAKVTLGKFAQAYCDGLAICGSEGSFKMAECLGRARAALMGTVGSTSGALYGSLRDRAVTEVVSCLEEPLCGGRRDADDELGACLDKSIEKGRI